MNTPRLPQPQAPQPRGTVPVEVLTAYVTAFAASLAKIGTGEAITAEGRTERDAVIRALYFDVGLSYTDIEKLLGVPEGSARVATRADPRRAQVSQERKRRRHPRLPDPALLPPPPMTR